MARSLRSLNGVSMLKPYFFETACNSLPYILPMSMIDQPDTFIAPSLRLSDGSRTILLTSTSWRMPIPPQASQAPKGLLNEKLLGVSSSNVMPQSGQPYLDEYIVSLPSISTATDPSASFIAVSTESVRRLEISGLTFNLSMTTYIVCLNFLSSSISSSNDLISPSTLTLAYPSFLSLSNKSLNSPFLPRTTGAEMINLEPSGARMISAFIVSTPTAEMTLPHLGQ